MKSKDEEGEQGLIEMCVNVGQIEKTNDRDYEVEERYVHHASPPLLNRRVDTALEGMRRQFCRKTSHHRDWASWAGFTGLGVYYLKL